MLNHRDAATLASIRNMPAARRTKNSSFSIASRRPRMLVFREIAPPKARFGVIRRLEWLLVAGSQPPSSRSNERWLLRSVDTVPFSVEPGRSSNIGVTETRPNSGSRVPEARPLRPHAIVRMGGTTKASVLTPLAARRMSIMRVPVFSAVKVVMVPMLVAMTRLKEAVPTSLTFIYPAPSTHPASMGATASPGDAIALNEETGGQDDTNYCDDHPQRHRFLNPKLASNRQRGSTISSHRRCAISIRLSPQQIS
jgi:hypothetical protein